MYIEFQLPQDGVQGNVQAYDEAGNEVQVSRIVYTPYFFKSSSVPVILFASLFKGKPTDKKQSDKSARQRCVVTVSGTKANLRFQDRTEHVRPLYEDPKAKKEDSDEQSASREPRSG